MGLQYARLAVVPIKYYNIYFTEDTKGLFKKSLGYFLNLITSNIAQRFISNKACAYSNLE